LAPESSVKVPILDLPGQFKPLKKAILKGWEAALDSGQFISGPQGAAFEKESAHRLGVRHALAVNSGTDALVIGLRALGVGPGDEVLTTAFSFFATAEAISLVGAKPVFCDIDPRTFLMDVKDAGKRMNSRVKAVLPVHLYGLPMRLKPLLALTKKRGIRVLEDACQAFGASTGEGACGTVGDAGAFSFYPTKNLGAAGDSGLLVTGDEGLAARAAQLRNHGSGAVRNVHGLVGYCSRMDELQAVVLRAKLPRLAAWAARRRAVAKSYLKGLSGLGGLQLPVADPACVWHQFAVRVKGGRREALAAALREAGVASAVFYPIPIHRQSVYASLRVPSLPQAEAAAQEVLCLPIYPELSARQVGHVVTTVKKFFR
jgi:dTDP-4-amino-4,6-dideoxygalactose transaminase